MRFQTACFQSWHSSSTDGSCADALVCNWAKSIETTASSAGFAAAQASCLYRDVPNSTTVVSFCGATDNGADYVQLAGVDQATCATRSLCLLNNGSQLVTTRGQCAIPALATCSVPGFATQPLCEAGGVCSNEFIFYDRLGNYRSGGVCIDPSSPFHIEECPGVLIGDRPVADGCVVYAKNRTTCTAPGKWVMPATTQAECEQERQCKRAVREKEVQDFFLDELWTMQDQASCLAEGAQWIPRYTWTTGTWRTPSERTPSWVASALISRWSYTNQSVIMSRLHDDLETAVNAKIRFQRKSYTFCRFGRYPATLAQISCACDTPAEDSVAECFAEHVQKGASSIGKTVAVTDICGGAATVIAASPASASFTETSITPFGECVPVSLVTVAALNYQSNEGGSTATYFIDFRYSLPFPISHFTLSHLCLRYLVFFWFFSWVRV